MEAAMDHSRLTSEGWIIAEQTMPASWIDPVVRHEQQAYDRWKSRLAANPLADTVDISVLAHGAIWQQRTNAIIKHMREWLMNEAIRQNTALTAWDGWSGIVGAVPSYRAARPQDVSGAWHALVQERLRFRVLRDWTCADAVRDRLQAVGVTIAEIGMDRATWTRCL